MSTPDTDLRTPSEWAEHYGITGLVPEEWQHFAKVKDANDDWVDGPVPEWERPQTHTEFRRTLHGEWRPPVTNENRYARQAPRSKKMPKFAPTAEAVLDALGEHYGWVPTTAVTRTLAEPMGWHGYDLPPNTKVMNHLKALAEAGTVVEENSGIDNVRIPTAKRGEGTTKMWMTAAIYESLKADRTTDEGEQYRRTAKLAGWLSSLDPTLPAEVAYSHGTRLMYVEGEYVADADSGRITLDWATMERIINLSPRNGPSHG